MTGSLNINLTFITLFYINSTKYVNCFSIVMSIFSMFFFNIILYQVINMKLCNINYIFNPLPIRLMTQKMKYIFTNSNQFFRVSMPWIIHIEPKFTYDMRWTMPHDNNARCQ